MGSYLTVNILDSIIYFSGDVLSQRQDRPSRGGETVVYSFAGTALGDLDIDFGSHEMSWNQVGLGQGNLLLIATHHLPSVNESILLHVL